MFNGFHICLYLMYIILIFRDETHMYIKQIPFYASMLVVLKYIQEVILMYLSF
uniref:Uncharacterized protein n=1 Tax=Arundo donax TaxID=35708 RepID=A0A0A9C8I5_ARUDO